MVSQIPEREALTRLGGALLARCTFPAPGTAVDCAVSGGADSLALLVLAVAAGCRVTAHHVDHGLRDGSASEAEVVSAAALRFGAGFRSLRVEVAPGPNLEARARAARYSVLPNGVLVGHTADDQAETVLLNLMRGAGLSGLAGIDPRRRPMLGIRRSDTHALCAAAGLRPVQDASNDDLSILRNRVRAELLPMMGSLASRDVAAVISRQAVHLADDAALLDELAEGIDVSDARALAAAPEPLARRAVRRWLRAAIDEEQHPPGAAAVGRVLAVARGHASATEVGKGLRVRRSRQRLHLERVVAEPT